MNSDSRRRYIVDQVSISFSSFRLTRIAILLLGGIMLMPASSSNNALAQSRPFGVGFILGSPTGLSIKYWQSRGRAIDGGIAWFSGRSSNVYLHGDILRHNFNATQSGRTPLYYGIGARFIFNEANTDVGIRFPLGISHLFSQEPFDVFFELAPILNLSPRSGLYIDGGFGIRYYFKR